MTQNITNRAGFIKLRALIALLLCAAGTALAVIALTPALQPTAAMKSGWLRRIASSAGIHSQSQRIAANLPRGGGAAALSNQPAEQAQARATQSEPDAPYAAPQNDPRPVQAVRSGELRHVHPIHPSKAPKHDHPEPIRPAPPSQSGGTEGPLQTTPGQQYSAPTATGSGFDGVGTGTAGFVPSSNPPDVNGRVGATQFVQWNNTSFAVFDKTTGALQYGPAAGNTLFQSLGGVCASHNDGDPVVSYDILAGRWVLSQFVVDGPTGSASHECVAVSATSDALGDYYVYDFLTDGTNFVDYPHTGVWPDGYYMSAHVINAAGTSLVAGRV
jgi:hypothetical protein